jgi:hypothetical protein
MDNALGTELQPGNGLAVLTDNLDLYVTLLNLGIYAFNFTHLQALEWQV